MTEKTQYLHQLPYWEVLTDQERTQLQRCTVIQRYQKGQLIYGHDSECLGMALVLKGAVRAYILSEEGREITLFHLRQNDSCVLSASCVMSEITFDIQMTAEQETELLVVPSGFFGQLAEQNRQVRQFTYEVTAARFSAAMQVMQNVLFKSFDQRLSAFLIQEYERTGLTELKMTHEQIAQNTSSAREVVARTLKRFCADGLVDLRRGCVRLTDINGLRRLC